MKKLLLLFTIILIAASFKASAQSKNDSTVLRNDAWDKTNKSGFRELNIPSSGSLLQGFMYTPMEPGSTRCSFCCMAIPVMSVTWTWPK